jgi:hypothetical protein
MIANALLSFHSRQGAPRFLLQVGGLHRTPIRSKAIGVLPGELCHSQTHAMETFADYLFHLAQFARFIQSSVEAYTLLRRARAAEFLWHLADKLDAVTTRLERSEDATVECNQLYEMLCQIPYFVQAFNVNDSAVNPHCADEGSNRTDIPSAWPEIAERTPQRYNPNVRIADKDKPGRGDQLGKLKQASECFRAVCTALLTSLCEDNASFD